MTNKATKHLNWQISLFLCIGIILLVSLSSKSKVIASSDHFHSVEEYSTFTGLLDSLPNGYNSLFAASGECVQCHGRDTAMIASIDPLGNDVNVVDDWRATMMANSAKDPFWRAKVSHEVTIYPEKQEEIENSCTDCHAPLGYFAAYHQGATSYTISDMVHDSIGLDGVSCLACHQQSEFNLGNTHSGNLNFDTMKVAYGPYISPLSSPMLEETGYEPIYSEHINDAGICASCHTLVTETLDYEGEPTGGSFVEQATYHEWLNSAYEAENTSCQECHMPLLTKGQFQIANGYAAPPRSEFALHELAGANVTMLKLLRDNAAELGISASAEDFESVIAATENMLRYRTLNVELIDIERGADTLRIAVKLTNKAGHKFPSGYPSRRAFIHLVVDNPLHEDTLFNSGRLEENFEVYGQNSTYEPHYTTIRSDDEVQIYEQVMGDVNDDVTTVLTRAAYHIKDNRIPPRGFSKKHAVYDTTEIAGNALIDIDFNQTELGIEGSGSDIVYYNIPVHEQIWELNVKASVYYQATPPKWMDEMFSESTEEIELFRKQFAAVDKAPTLVGLDSLYYDPLVAVNDLIEEWPVEVIALGNGQVEINVPEDVDVNLYTLTGQLVLSKRITLGSSTIETNFREKILIIQLKSGTKRFTKKLWLP